MGSVIKEIIKKALPKKQLEYIQSIRAKHAQPQRMHIIEITGNCNATCTYCPTGNAIDKSKKIMHPDLLEKIIIHQKKQKLLQNGQVLQLYNYGEPFINTHINEILEVVKKHGHTAGFSSNFIKLPKIKDENFDAIAFVVFSLCGLTEETYHHIYGGKIERTLSNFDAFLERKKEHNNNIQMTINWLMYRFNESQFDEAKEYFEKRNCEFRPISAYVNDVQKMIDVGKGTLDKNQYKKIDLDIDLDSTLKRMNTLKKKYPDYHCPQLDGIVINESGKLLCCSELDRDHENYDLGDILSLDAKETMKRKKHVDICKDCLKYGVAQLIHEGYRDN